MRDIEFRGKTLDGGEWVYGYLVSVSDKSRCTIYVPNDPKICDWATLPFAVDPATVGQYTGLTDRDGRRIYEGDILSWDVKAWIGGYNEHVRWSYEQFTMRENDWGEYCTVVGNIHDNPEILT